MPTVLALSPHLDDAAFSCGATLAQLVDRGWRVVMATAFTATVPHPTGFALACQTDKGLAPEVDYMALRRAEDRAAATILGIADVRWLGLREAPHRGYHSAPALFAGIRDGDEAWRELAPLVAALRQELQPDLVLCPQGLGGHVDHRHMIRAVAAGPGPGATAYYRDTPYAIRNPAATPDVVLDGLALHALDAAAGLERKVGASCAYTSQIGFQFGGVEALAVALHAFALQEGAGLNGVDHPAERFLGAPGCLAAVQP